MGWIHRCPDCDEPLWARMRGAELAPLDDVICISCGFTEPLGEHIPSPSQDIWKPTAVASVVPLEQRTLH
jgi:hypothetical protein